RQDVEQKYDCLHHCQLPAGMGGKSQLLPGRLHDGQVEKFDGHIEKHEQNHQAAENAAGPDHRAGILHGALPWLTRPKDGLEKTSPTKARNLFHFAEMAVEMAADMGRFRRRVGQRDGAVEILARLALAAKLQKKRAPSAKEVKIARQ